MIKDVGAYIGGALVNATLRATFTVGLTLVCAFVGTGVVTSGYEHERSKLGERHYHSGEALTGVNDLSGAAEEFRKALLFAPDNREYRLSLATALVSGGRLEEAESHLEQLSQEDPTNGRINLLLARVALRQHQPTQALESYQRAVYEYWPPEELDKRREARWELISLLEQNGNRRDQLVGELLQLYGNLPPHSDQRIRVGQVLLRAGADAEAAHVFHDVVKDGKDLAKAHSGLARIAFRSGDFIEARHEYQRALKVAPDDLATTSDLRLTNEIVDIAPELPNISPNERLRRSQNLLNRVESDLAACARLPDQKLALETRLDDVKQANRQKLTDKDDAAEQLQQLAQELWKARTSFCTDKIADPALEAVLPRLGHEQQ